MQRGGGRIPEGRRLKFNLPTLITVYLFLSEVINLSHYGRWNVIDLNCWNQTALSKQFWNLTNKKDVLWAKWVHEYYIKGINVLLIEVPSQASWIVRKVFDGAKTFSNVNGNVFQQANFSIKRMYNALRGDFVKVSWRKMKCNKRAPPKGLFVTWLAIHGRLPTCDRLSKVGIYCDQTCILCKKENETHSHLFFTCKYSKVVWAGAMQWSNMNINACNWQIVMQKSVQQEHWYSCMSRMILSITQYMIWKGRNAIKFQHIHQSVQKLLN